MGFWDSITDFGGGRFSGSMTSEGSGARVRAGVRDVPVIGDVDLVNVHVDGFRDGGVVGEPRRDKDGKLRGRITEAPATPEPRRPRMTPSRMFGTAALDNRPGADAIPEGTAGTSSRSRSSSADVGGHTPVRGGSTSTMGRRRHEIAPGVPCPSCAAGITKPVR
ncbi:hypothetical protein [Gordonia sp. HS-NH1]|uniref:hypothetical protein n=1 Tax=Gordonia sp. HS-NH1 TaxID=1435068 RepID=UPI0006E214FD|nr:hypothetical protein [Gordonia sp. HS-NH1]